MLSEITIVIPSYNHAKYVQQTLASCAALETGGDRPHLIVIDDGSTDESLRVASDYLKGVSHAFQSVRIESKKNSGLSNSLNFGLRELKTKYMLMISSDDVFCENAIQVLLPAIKSNPKAAIAVGDNSFIDGAGETVARVVNGQSVTSFLDFFIKLKPRFDPGLFGKYESFLTGNYIPAGWLVDVEKIRSLGGWDETYRLEDWEILVRATKKYELQIERVTTAKYRTHDTNTSKLLGPALLLDAVRIFLREYDHAEANGLLSSWRWGPEFIRSNLKDSEDFFKLFFLKVSDFFEHKSFKYFLAGLANKAEADIPNGDFLAYRAILNGLKIKMLNDITDSYRVEPWYVFPKADAVILENLDFYIETFENAKEYGFIEDWRRGVENIQIALKSSPAFRPKLYTKMSELLSLPHTGAFLRYLYNGRDTQFPTKGTAVVSNFLLNKLRIKLALWSLLKKKQ